MSKKVIIILFAVFLISACATYSLSQKAPIPPDVNIKSADPSLPAAVRALIGQWAGQWGSRYIWENVLYIERVEKDSAQIVLSGGEFTALGCHCAAGWKRRTVNLQSSNGKLMFNFNTGTGAMYFTFQSSTPDEMEGIFINARHTLYITLKRLP